MFENRIEIRVLEGRAGVELLGFEESAVELEN
jgi:hypothetical protein